MKLFKFKSYSYKPSFEGKTKQRIISLTNKYESIFLKQIEGTLSKEEEKELYQGIKEVEKYILKSVFFKMNEDYNGKTPLEKKAEAIYRRVLNYYDQLEMDIEDVVRDSIYEALGFSKNKVFKKEKESSYFIKYVMNITFFNVLLFLEKKLNAVEYEKENTSIDNYEEEIEDIDCLLESSGLKAALPKDTYAELKECLDRKESPEKHLVPYLEFLLSFKEENENVCN